VSISTAEAPREGAPERSAGSRHCSKSRLQSVRNSCTRCLSFQLNNCSKSELGVGHSVTLLGTGLRAENLNRLKRVDHILELDVVDARIGVKLRVARLKGSDRGLVWMRSIARPHAKCDAHAHVPPSYGMAKGRAKDEQLENVTAF